MESCAEPFEPPREDAPALGEPAARWYATAFLEERIQILRGTPGDDRQDMHIWPVVDAGNLRCEANRRTLKQAAGEADRPGVHLVFFCLCIHVAG